MPASPLRTYRILAAALMGALVVIGIALAFIVHGGTTQTRNGHTVHTHAPSAGLYIAIVVLGVIAAALVQSFGYRIPPLSPDTDASDARATGLRVYQQTMFLRFALSEAVAIVAIALVFSFDSDTELPYVLAAVISLVLMAVHVWPSQSLISRVQAKLDRNGGRSDLSNALRGAY